MDTEAARRELQDVFMRLLATSFTEAGAQDLSAAVALLERFPALAAETFPIRSLDSPWGAHPKVPLFLVAAFGADLDEVKRVYNLHPLSLLITQCPELVTLVKRSKQLDLTVLSFLAEKYPTLMTRPNKVGRLAIQELLLSTKQPLRDSRGEAIGRREFQRIQRHIDVMIQHSPLDWCTADLLQRALQATSISEEIVDLILQHLPDDVEHLTVGQAVLFFILTMRSARMIAKVLPRLTSFTLRFLQPHVGIRSFTPYENQDVFDYLLGELAVACTKTSEKSKVLKRLCLDIPSFDDCPRVCEMVLPNSAGNTSTLSHVELQALKRVTFQDYHNLRTESGTGAFQSEITNQLEHNNTTLVHFKLEISTLVPNASFSINCNKVQFFTALNGYGRERLRGTEASKDTLMDILDRVTRYCRDDPAKSPEQAVPFLYALLQDNPTLWVPACQNRKRKVSGGEATKAFPSAKRQRLQLGRKVVGRIDDG